MAEATKKKPAKAAASNGAQGKLSHYKSRPEKKRYTKAERELIALWQAVFEVMDKQEKLNP